MSDPYNWKQVRMQLTTGAATFGVVVPATMHMKVKDICYTNVNSGANEAILRQIPSGNIRPPSAVIIDDEIVGAGFTSYSPIDHIRVVQENCVIEASAAQGPMNVTLAYRLYYGRP